jgi:uroporphyrinogen-III synthase
MVNLNQTLQNNVIDYVSITSKSITEIFFNFFKDQGFNFSIRWVGMLLFFMSLLILYIGMKISQKILKVILIILGVVLAVGFLIPW